MISVISILHRKFFQSFVFYFEAVVAIMAHSDRTYVGKGPGPEWVTVYYVKPSHCKIMWDLKRVLYFGIVSVPVPVQHNFSLIRP